MGVARLSSEQGGYIRLDRGEVRVGQVGSQVSIHSSAIRQPRRRLLVNGAKAAVGCSTPKPSGNMRPSCSCSCSVFVPPVRVEFCKPENYQLSTLNVQL